MPQRDTRCSGEGEGLRGEKERPALRSWGRREGGPGSDLPCPQALATLLQETVGELEAAQALVLKRIQIWKRQQQLAGNGAPFEESLAPLQERLGQD